MRLIKLGKHHIVLSKIEAVTEHEEVMTLPIVGEGGCAMTRARQTVLKVVRVTTENNVFTVDDTLENVLVAIKEAVLSFTYNVNTPDAASFRQRMPEEPPLPIEERVVQYFQDRQNRKSTCARIAEALDVDQTDMALVLEAGRSSKYESILLAGTDHWRLSV